MKRFFMGFLFVALACALSAQTTKVGGSGKAKVGGSGKTLVSPVSAPPAGLSIVHNAKNSAGAQTAAITVTQTAGNLIVVAMVSYGGTQANHAVTDNINGGTGWTKVVGVDNVTGSGENESVSIWYNKNAASGITTVTVDGGSPASLAGGSVFDVAGASTTAPFTTGEFNSAHNDSATTNPQTGTVTNATANSIYFAICSTDAGVNPCTYTLNATGTTGTWNYNSSNSYELDGTTFVTFAVANIIVSSSTARGHGWTTDSDQTAQAVAVFHP